MTVDETITEFRRAYVAGTRPDAAAFIQRVPEADRDAVRRGIRLVLLEEPPPNPTPETLMMVQAMLRGEQPLIVLRTSKGLTRDLVVHRLRELLGLRPEREPKVAEYYHQIETGQLPLAGIRDTVFDALATAFGVARSSLMLKGPSGAERGTEFTAFARGADPAALLELRLPLLHGPGDEIDEVDDLFTGGPG